jgi:hypothetical protein
LRGALDVIVKQSGEPVGVLDAAGTFVGLLSFEDICAALADSAPHGMEAVDVG